MVLCNGSRQFSVVEKPGSLVENLVVDAHVGADGKLQLDAVFISMFRQVLDERVDGAAAAALIEVARDIYLFVVRIPA